jgi:hypothetical protein
MSEFNMMMAIAPLNPFVHYWAIGGSETEVYSSAANSMVPVDDPDYLAWGRTATPIPSEAELADVLKAYPVIKPWLFNAADSFIQPAAGVYSAPQLKAYSDDARWRKEQGGIVTTAGFPIKTDDRAQAKITGVWSAASIQPDVITPWHCADGTVVQLDAAGMTAMHDDLLTHFNDCFSISADNYTAIDAGTMTTLEEIDAAFAAPITAARKNWLKPKK